MDLDLNIFLSFTFSLLRLKHLVVQSLKLSLNSQAPVAQKIADEVIFRRFQGA